DRGPGDPRVARARLRGGRRLFDGRSRRASPGARRPDRLHRAAPVGRELSQHSERRRGGRDLGLRGRASRVRLPFGARRDTAAVEAEASYGEGALYLEKVLAPARHVEVQVLCDAEGGVLTLGERECSIQRRHQKLIEESPSAALDGEIRDQMESAVERACQKI